MSRILVAAAVALSVAAALAQTGRPQGRTARGAADGGTQRVRTPGPARPGPILLGTDPPGRLRPQSSTPDAGTAPHRITASDEVQRELTQLRARVDALEQERAQQQAQAQQLQQVVQEIQELRAQIAQGEQRKAAAEQQQRAQVQQRESGVAALQQAQAILAGGDSAVDDQLSQAEASFPPQAQRDVESARAALRNRDLSAARMYLDAAIQHAQQGQ